MLKTDELEKVTVRDHEHQKQHFVRPLCHIYLSVNFLILYILNLSNVVHYLPNQ